MTLAPIPLRTPPLPATTPLVSVVINVRDGARFLAQAIDSILTQTMFDLELIVVDDGSTDGTPGIIDTYVKRDARVRAFRQAPTGIAAAANRGLAEARTELVARLDQDDIALPDRLEKQVAWMNAHPEIIALGGWMTTIDEDGRHLTTRRYPTDPDAFRAAMVTSVAMAHPTAMFRKSVVMSVGGYRSELDYASDYDLWLRLEERGTLSNLPEVLTYYRLHAGQVTSRFRSEQARFAELALRLAGLRRAGQPDPIAEGLGLEAALQRVGLGTPDGPLPVGAPAPFAQASPVQAPPTRPNASAGVFLEIPVGTKRVQIEVAADLLADIQAFFPGATRAANGPAAVAIAGDGAKRFTVTIVGHKPQPRLARGEAIELIRRAVTMEVATGEPMAMRAAAATWANKAVLIVAPPGGGKSSLLAWLIEKGFAYASDDLAILDAAEGTIAGLAGPLAFQRQHLRPIVDLPAFGTSDSVRSGEIVLVAPERAWLAPLDGLSCGLVIFPRFVRGAGAHVTTLSVTEIAGRLGDAAYTPLTALDPRRAALAGFADRVPAFALDYGSFDDIDGVLAELVTFVLESGLTPSVVARFLKGFPQGLAAPARAQHFPIPAATKRRLSPRLTIGMATYDDYDGVYFTIQALRMYHPEIVDDVEFLVVDNHPSGAAGAVLKQLEGSIPNFRYVPYPEIVGTASAKDKVVAEAAGEFVMGIDCHVFVVPGAVRRLLSYFDAHRDTRDLLQGPLVYDDLKTLATHFAPRWSGGMYGAWDLDPRGADPDGPPFDIPMQGLGLFACRRDMWRGFNPMFRGFGAEEGYIHEKVRQTGGRTLCLPFLRWMHRFNRPLGAPYPNVWEERYRNYYIGMRELGLLTNGLHTHFTELLGAELSERALKLVRAELGETDD